MRQCAIVATSLRLGDAVLIVATPDHRDQLIRALEDAGIDVRQRVREGRYTMLDAVETLSTFMRNGMPDAVLFLRQVGSSIIEARQRARSKHRGLTVFGEMVAILWGKGQRDAALRLEQLWNDELATSSFHLHCAYPRDIFAADADLNSVYLVHTHVLQ